MIGRRIFTAIAFIITTGIFVGLGLYLKNSVESGLLFLENNDSLLAESIILFSPFILTIILGWIKHIKIWIGSLLTILACTGVNAVLGEATTPRHVPLFIVCLAIPYVLCLVAVFHDSGFYSVPKRSSGYTSSSSSSDYTGSSNSGYDPSLGVNTYMTIWGTNEPVYYKDGEYVDRHGNHVSITDIDD